MVEKIFLMGNDAVKFPYGNPIFLIFLFCFFYFFYLGD